MLYDDIFDQQIKRMKQENDYQIEQMIKAETGISGPLIMKIREIIVPTISFKAIQDRIDIVHDWGEVKSSEKGIESISTTSLKNPQLMTEDLNFFKSLSIGNWHSIILRLNPRGQGMLVYDHSKKTWTSWNDFSFTKNKKFDQCQYIFYKGKLDVFMDETPQLKEYLYDSFLLENPYYFEK